MKLKNIQYIVGLNIALKRLEEQLSEYDQRMAELMRENENYKIGVDRLKSQYNELSKAKATQGTYRLLDTGEEIQDIDDYFDPIRNEWNAVSLDTIGLVVDSYKVPVRRKIKHS